MPIDPNDIGPQGAALFDAIELCATDPVAAFDALCDVPVELVAAGLCALVSVIARDDAMALAARVPAERRLSVICAGFGDAIMEFSRMGEDSMGWRPTGIRRALRIDLEPQVERWATMSDSGLRSDLLGGLREYAVPRPVKFQMRGQRSKVLRRMVAERGQQ